jgi:hypothetical protein
MDMSHAIKDGPVFVMNMNMISVCRNSNDLQNLLLLIIFAYILKALNHF